MATTETALSGDLLTVKERLLPKLRLLYSPGIGTAAAHRTFTLPIGTTCIGRELDGVVGIELAADKRASRVHACVEVAADLSVRVVDQNSKNGTFINRALVGDKTASALGLELDDGDILRIGDSFLLLRHEPAKLPDADIPTLIGVAPAVAALRHRIARIAADAATVLVLGQTGTGKDVVATALHKHSQRAGAYVPVNCSAIPKELAESQFFGHTAGAFTGAKAHLGFFRAAHRGTLFLDEIGEVDAALQAKLLRALEDHAVTPVGATESQPADVRIIAATNRDLQRAMDDGLFREDLYARLADIVLHLPPLHERREDILLLLRHASGGRVTELPPELVELLLFYSWPRNVREVNKIADHLRLFGADDALRARLVPAVRPGKKAPGPEPLPNDLPVTDLKSAEPSVDAEAVRPAKLVTPNRERLAELMQKHEGVIHDVARALGCSRRQVGRWLEQYGLDRNSFRSGQ